MDLRPVTAGRPAAELSNVNVKKCRIRKKGHRLAAMLLFSCIWSTQLVIMIGKQLPESADPAGSC